MTSLQECNEHLLAYLKAKFVSCNLDADPGQIDVNELHKVITDPGVKHIFNTTYGKITARGKKISRLESSNSGPLPYAYFGKAGKLGSRLCIQMFFEPLRQTELKPSCDEDESCCFQDEVNLKSSGCKHVSMFAIPGVNLRSCEFTKPLITPTDRAYRKLKVGDFIYVFQKLESSGSVAHLAALIVTTDGDVYSFGFGFPHGSSRARNAREHMVEILPGTLYTPDGPLERGLIDQINNPSMKFVELVAASTLTEQSLQNLNMHFDRIVDLQDTYITWTGPLDTTGMTALNYDEDTKEKKLKPVNDVLYNIMGQLLKYAEAEEGDEIRGDKKLHRYPYTYNDVQTGQRNPLRMSPESIVAVAYKFRRYVDTSALVGISYRATYYWASPVEYCELSSVTADKLYHKKQTLNCARYIYTIFDDIINCTFSTLAVAPSKCGQRRGVPYACKGASKAVVKTDDLYGIAARTLHQVRK
jgi:hypothetical protein